jgi:hypothetical protein
MVLAVVPKQALQELLMDIINLKKYEKNNFYFIGLISN